MRALLILCDQLALKGLKFLFLILAGGFPKFGFLLVQRVFQLLLEICQSVANLRFAILNGVVDFEIGSRHFQDLVEIDDGNRLAVPATVTTSRKPHYQGRAAQGGQPAPTTCYSSIHRLTGRAGTNHVTRLNLGGHKPGHEAAFAGK